MKNEKHVLIMDQVGRYIVGLVEGENSNEITLHNPIILSLEPGQGGQLAMNLFPLFFFELMDKNQRNKNSWTFNKGKITVSNVELNPDIIARYTQINTPQPTPATKSNPKVISIDDI